MSIRQLFSIPTTTPCARLLAAASLALAAMAAQAGVDINRASLAELETVKGIGPSLSTRILKAREQSKFANWDDLRQRVRGIGTTKAARLSSEGLTVGGAAYAATDSDLARSKEKRAGTPSARTSLAEPSRTTAARDSNTAQGR